MIGAKPGGGGDRITIVAVDRLELRLAPYAWPFARERGPEIDAFFAEQQRQRAGLWNGRVLMLRDFAIADGIFRGTFFETDYSAFLSWLSWDFPDDAVKNAFAAGALRSADGAFVLGEMGPDTANAGQIYFPCGTPDPADLDGTRVDLDGSIHREIGEEIGIREGEYDPEPGWSIVLVGARVALIKVLHARHDADALRLRIAAHLARQQAPELCGIRMVRGPADIDPRIPPFARAFLSHIWSG
jgi:hypothetical protein